MKTYSLLIILLITLLSACNNQPQTATPEAQSISLQLAWIHEYSSSMLHAAVKEGYFAEHNLDVTLEVGGFSENGYIEPIAQVVAGEADFGFSDAFTLIQARNDGQPVVGVASMLQRSPSALVSLEANHIQRPQDLAGHSVTIAEGGAMMLFDTLIDTQGVDPTSITIVPRTAFGVDPLLNNEVDSLLGWITNEGVSVEEAGEHPDYILLSDYGIESYNFVLFTTDDMIANHPEVVQAMVDSIKQGIEFIVSNPQKAIDYTLEFNPELDADAQLRRLQASIPLMNVPNVPLASMDADVWNFAYGLMSEQGLVDENFDVSSAFTLEFLGENK